MLKLLKIIENEVNESSNRYNECTRAGNVCDKSEILIVYGELNVILNILYEINKATCEYYDKTKLLNLCIRVENLLIEVEEFMHQYDYVIRKKEDK